ncbi:hypothetical protein [Mycolicibacterium grossiae]|uniref:Mce protein n=1 Tax=Mycolicibacterium grossiae TaxID=1552759 RepID=A0A1E8PYB1_9MYCO|nr:hypothetical protein [Mycolicibacterium grossiae]OFJ51298.1 hypothetical protein BEL07_23535 [Mycolicibacterium grossiae]QEM47435.1 hypothetical protein FZ046_24065 [Mycolicibacterium grossiae]
MAASERTSQRGGDSTPAPRDPTSPEDALALAEEAEAEAAEAEAVAAAARARARAIRLRRAAATPPETGTPTPPETGTSTPPETGTSATVEAAPAAPPETVAEPNTSLDAEPGAATTEPDVTEAEPVAEAPARRRTVPLRAVVGALAVVLTLGLLGASGYMIWHHQRVVAAEQRSAEYAAAARQGVVTLMSLDFTRAEEDVQRILDNTTGDFRKDFESQAESFTQVAQQSKVVTEATVTATAVQAMSDRDATVLVAVTTQVSNAASAKQEPRSWRLIVGVARDGDQIKLAKVEFVP